MSVVNYMDLCRCCTANCSGNVIVNIFENKIHNVYIFEVISKITNLEIDIYDGFPEHICLDCENRLKVAYEIRALTESSFSKLKLLKRSKPRNQSFLVTNDCEYIVEDVIEVNANSEVVDDMIVEDINEDELSSDAENVVEVRIVPAPKILNKTPAKSPIKSRPKVNKYSTPRDTSPPVENLEEDEAVSLMTKIMKTMKSTPQGILPVKLPKTGSPDERRFKCEICDKCFLKKSNLEDHMRLHLNVREYKCEDCGRTFVQSGNYRAHLRTHTKEKPYTCTLCPKSYTQSSALKVHIRSHTQEKNFICFLQTCKKAFTNSSDLKKHELIHSGVKKFTCFICGKKFTQKANMQKHEKTCKIQTPKQNSGEPLE